MSIEIGHRLRQARESLGYTLEEMEREIQIPAAYLAALEAGDWSSLPSPYYARAYLRSYGTRLGLEPRSFIQSMKRTGATNQGSRQARSRSQPNNRRTGRSQPEAGTGEGRISRRAGTIEGTGAGAGTARRPSLPPDMPDPHELGLSSRGRQLKRSVDEATESEEERPLRRSAKTGGGAALSRGARSRRTEGKGKEISLGTWYTRFLIIGAILLIPATAALIWLMVFSDADQPAPPPEPAEQQTADEGAAGEEEAGETAGAILAPLQTGGEGPDRYELTNVESIELNLAATGECWFQIRSQEVGGMLEDRVLRAGDTFPFSYKDGQTLWLQLGNAANVDVTVNGQKINTDVAGSKQIEIKWVK